MNTFPVMYSMLSSDALRDFVNIHFDLGQVTTCKILSRGLNDTYAVITGDSKYVLRVYRSRWRTRAEVDYELEVLDYLSLHGLSVSAPIRNVDGDFACEVIAPEGLRYVTLFTYAEGKRTRLDSSISYEYGKSAAQMHNLTDDFVPSQPRPPLDLTYLLDEPLKVVAPVMVEYGGDISYVHAWVRAIRERLFGQDMDFGFCHGDIHDWNAHWNGHKLTLFDFDCCGQGYRAYDLAVFLWNLKTNYKGQEPENWMSFLEGYRAVRPITDIELESIPWFVAARRIWLAGVYLSNEDVWGTGIVNDGFFRSFVDQLKEDESSMEIQIR